MVLERRHELVRLTESAVAVALSVLLGNVRLVELPNGGSIALAVVPLLALACARGCRAALLAGCCAGIAHALSGGTIVHPAQLALDYLLAYAVLAVAGVGATRRSRPTRATLALPIVAAMAAHLAMMVLSGVVFFAPVAGDAAIIYSIAYNAATVLPETLLAIWLVPPLVLALARANPADSWRRGLLEPPAREGRGPRSIRVVTGIDTRDVSRDLSATATDTGPETPRARPAAQVTLVRTAPFAGRPMFRSPRLRPASDTRVAASGPASASGPGRGPALGPLGGPCVTR